MKTGYDWNKYNQTHYDHDNPPPKSVQGYKFNIFYPDLIDKSVTPKYVAVDRLVVVASVGVVTLEVPRRYYLEPADVPEFVIIRFHAGPPYEDIAFKIVNKCVRQRGCVVAACRSPRCACVWLCVAQGVELPAQARLPVPV